MRNFLNIHKMFIDFILSIWVMAVSAWILIAEIHKFNQNIPNIILVVLAMISVPFRLLTIKIDKNLTAHTIVHTLLHVISLFVIIILICMNDKFNPSFGNLGTFVISVLSCITSEWLLQPPSPKSKTTTSNELKHHRLRNQMKSVINPSNFRKQPVTPQDSIRNMREVYRAIISDEHHSQYKRDEFKNHNQKYYDMLNNPQALSSDDLETCYSFLYHGIVNYLDKSLLE